MADASKYLLSERPGGFHAHAAHPAAELVSYLKPYWVGLLVLVSLMAAGAFLEVLPSEFTLRLIDHHLAKGSLAGSGPSSRASSPCWWLDSSSTLPGSPSWPGWGRWPCWT